MEELEKGKTMKAFAGRLMARIKEWMIEKSKDVTD